MLVTMLAGYACSAERHILKLGMLSKMNATEEQFRDTWNDQFAPRNGKFEVAVKFYEALDTMILDLEIGGITHMVLPYASAQYVLNKNRNYESVLMLNSNNMGLAFGFRDDSRELRRKFNEALNHMRDNWILQSIEGLYLASPGIDEPEPVEFEKFPGADTIKVAVTGDLPPIDYIAPDGTPAGFNTAVLAEIGAYLKKNIQLVEIASGARTAALVSGRADVVFWYEIDTSSEVQNDVPKGVILSEPYYTWNRFIHIRKAPGGSSSRNWNLKRDIMGLYNW